MKKRLVCIISLIVCLLFAACTSNSNKPSDTPTPDAVEATISEEPTGSISSPDITQTLTPAPTDTPDSTSTPDIGNVEKNVEAMMPILDSIIRTLGIEGEFAFDSEDPEIFWSVLYLMGENWGSVHPLVTVEEDFDYTTIVPRQVMQEFASAAFLAYDDLLPIPDDYAQAVQYDESLDAYRLSPSDMGDAITHLESVSVSEGVVTVIVGYYVGEVGTDELLGKFDFTLVDNPYADAISDPIFVYTVGQVMHLD